MRPLLKRIRLMTRESLTVSSSVAGRLRPVFALNAEGSDDRGPFMRFIESGPAGSTVLRLPFVRPSTCVRLCEGDVVYSNTVKEKQWKGLT